MAFACPQIHKPRQVIVVALLTSLFWFALNTVILISYQGNFAAHEVKLARRLREENENFPPGFEQQLEDGNKVHKLLPRGISEVEDFEEELDTINKEVVQHKEKDPDKQVVKNDFIGEIENDSLNKLQLFKSPSVEKAKKKSKVLKKKQISAVKTIQTENPRRGLEGANDVEHVPNLLDIKSRDPNGPGEHGKAVVVPQGEKKNEKEGYNKYAFNEYVSQKISLVRFIPDTRSPGCDGKSYPVSDLPTTSVIICFHNEAWSTLLRTVHTVLLRSPPHLLKEIILIDDFSTFDHLKKPLEVYVAKLGKVRILRTTKREGLIRARLLGAEAAKAHVLTFLDAHCEANVGWLEPLLDRIRQDHTTVAVPVIDIISSSDFSYSQTPAEVIGGFSWDMQFTWHSLPQNIRNQRQDLSQPIRTPTMAGGLFAIDRKYFYNSGSYDPGMDVWGGENLEMSFRIWQCGGKLEIVPCSRVGHVFRSRFPYKFPGGYQEVTVNLARVVHVWMDDYKRFVFTKRADLKTVNHGDLSSRLELRKRLKCKSFKWYLENIYPDQQIPGTDYLAHGEVRNPKSGYCLDTMARSFREELGVSPCHGMGGNQQFFVTKDHRLSIEQGSLFCIEASGSSLLIVMCDEAADQWTVSKGKLQNREGKCIELQTGRNEVAMKKCNYSADQEWIFTES